MAKFIDHVNIEIFAGKGGDGLMSFLKEKYVSKGGPSGGNGGPGGSIFFVAKNGLTTLQNLRYNHVYKAKDGGNGGSNNMQGERGEDLIIEVPLGTQIIEAESNNIIADIINEDEPVLILKGGKGGKGNSFFKSSTNMAPRIKENGDPGQHGKYLLELKVLADVGLVGMPSVGKSTLLATVSNARPKIADYPFTTLVPNLGIVSAIDGSSFVMADIPGLIKGAHAGKGLGIQFLKHIERCRLLVHILDGGDFDPDRDPYQEYLDIRNELKSHGYGLERKQEIVVINKKDISNPETIEELKKKIGKDVYVISTLAHDGTNELIQVIASAIKDIRPTISTVETKFHNVSDSHIIYKLDKDESEKWEIIPDPKDVGTWILQGELIDIFRRKAPLVSHQNFLRFNRMLDKYGVSEKLLNMVDPSDTIKVDNFEFTLGDDDE